VTKGISLNIADLIIAAIPAGVILVLIYVMLQTYSKTKKVTLSITTAINLALLVVAVVFWIRTGETIFSFGFFVCLYLCFLYVSLVFPSTMMNAMFLRIFHMGVLGHL